MMTDKPSPRQAIIEAAKAFTREHSCHPTRMRLPVLMAYDLMKCGRDELGELSERLAREGLTALEREPFYGMTVEIVRDRDATLQLE